MLQQLGKSAPRKKPYIDLPLRLKRRIWEADPVTFEKEIEDHVTAYTLSRHHLSYFSNDFIFQQLRSMGKNAEDERRRNDTHLQGIAGIIGTSRTLYGRCCRFVRSKQGSAVKSVSLMKRDSPKIHP